MSTLDSTDSFGALGVTRHQSTDNGDKGEELCVSFVIPCFNEEEVVGPTIRRLLATFRESGYLVEIVAVDNGSTDRTGEILNKMSADDPAVVSCRVKNNQGYGHGILSGIPHCRAPWICFIPADGQVDAEDVVMLYESVIMSSGKTIGKVRRRFRMDGMRRKFVSIAYNCLFRLMWPHLSSWDINGSPKLIRREHLDSMKLESKDWFLDPEIMIKAHVLGLRILELNAFSRMRGTGLSHVSNSTCWEFLRNLLSYRFSGRLTRWKRENTRSSQQQTTDLTSPNS